MNKIYVASSWRNTYYPDVVKALREAGHEVYDFRQPTTNREPSVSLNGRGAKEEGAANPPKGEPFKWQNVDADYMNWDVSQYRQGLTDPKSELQFKNDMEALQWADTCVLVLPCGRSAHTEAGWMAGQGKRTIVYIPQLEEAELMYKLFDLVTDDMNEVLEFLDTPASSTPVLHQKRFADLTNTELYELLRVRSEVFVVEQNCVYQDLDNDDQASLHLWLTVGEKVVALCRVCPAGVHMSNISIGRVITTERGNGYGEQMMRHAIDAAQREFGATLIDIEAQEYARGFYEKVGFKQSSDIFDLDGIPHIKMTWTK